MSLINIRKQISREITAMGNPSIRLQHEAFTAILLFDGQTEQLSGGMLRLQPALFKEMLVYARSQQWLQTQQLDDATQIKWQHNDAGLSDKLLLVHAPTQQPEASVTFFDYPGSFDSYLVHFRRESASLVAAPAG